MSAPPAGLVSVVVPVYGNAETIEPLHARLTATLADAPGGFEVVYVNDASPDRSPEVLAALSARDRRARVLHLRQNVGQHQALLAGFRAASGSRVVSIDADLQDPPEAIPALLEKLDEGFDAVFAARRGAYHDGPASRLTSRLFKAAQSRLAVVPPDAGAYVALRRVTVDRLLAMPAGSGSVVAMIGFAGGAVASIPVERAARPVGRSAFSFAGRLGLGLQTLVWSARMRLTGRMR